MAHSERKVNFYSISFLASHHLSIDFRLIWDLYGVYTSILTFYLVAPSANQSGNDLSPFLVLGPSCCGALFLLGYVSYGLWGAVSVLRGRDFEYLIIGSQLKRHLLSSA